MKSKIVKNIRGLVHASIRAKEFLDFMEQQFVALNKELTDTLISKLTIMKQNGVNGIRQQIMEMSNMTN